MILINSLSRSMQSMASYRFVQTRICASLELRMKFKTLFISVFMSDKEKHGHHFDLPLFFLLSKQFLAPGGLSVFKLVSCKHGASRELALRPLRPEKL